MKLIRLIGDFIRKRNPLHIEHITIPITGISSNLTSLKVAHVSDLHIPRAAFSPTEIADALKSQNPDVIFLTGDIVDGGLKFDGPTLALLIILLMEIAPVYAISGNHERRNRHHYKVWKTMLELRGVNYIDDKSARIEKDGIGFIIAGIRDISIEEILDFDSTFLSEIEVAHDECYLLLFHKPNIWRFCFPANAPIPNVVFSGHAHGGQIVIPHINRGLIAPDQGLFPKYISGLYQYSNNSYEVVSRGLASSTRPLRINNMPHIPIVELVPEGKENKTIDMA